MTVLDFSTPHVLRDEGEYRAAVSRVDALLDRDPDPGSPEYEELEFLSVLIEAYENEHLAEDHASPQELVDFMLDQRGLERADLHDAMGGRSRVSEFFSGKRPLSMGQVKALRELLGIPADALIPGSP